MFTPESFRDVFLLLTENDTQTHAPFSPLRIFSTTDKKGKQNYEQQEGKQVT